MNSKRGTPHQPHLAGVAVRVLVSVRILAMAALHGNLLFPIHSHSPAPLSDFTAAVDVAVPESFPDTDMPSVQLADLPPELIEQIAEHLPIRDILALASAHPRRFGPATDAVVRKRVIVEARTVESWAQLESVLAAIGRLATADRDQPLLELERSVVMLPRRERSAARTRILRAAAGLDVAVRDRLDAHRRISAHQSPKAAVLAGEPIEAVVDVLQTCRERRGENTSDEWRQSCTALLSCQIMQIAFADIARGENVRAVARRHGLQGDRIGELEHRCVVGPAADSILRGDDPDEAMRRHGLRDIISLRWLKSLHRQRDLDAGVTVPQMLDRREDPTNRSHVLMVNLAAMDLARCKIRWGRDDVSALAEEIGIQGAERIRVLKIFAADLRISAGADLRETARRFDLEGAADYRELSCNAAFNGRSILQRVAEGEDVHDVAERHGILPAHEGALAFMAKRPRRPLKPHPATSFEACRNSLRERVQFEREYTEPDDADPPEDQRYRALRDTIEARFDAPSSASPDRYPTP